MIFALLFSDLLLDGRLYHSTYPTVKLYYTHLLAVSGLCCFIIQYLSQILHVGTPAVVRSRGRVEEVESVCFGVHFSFIIERLDFAICPLTF